MEKIVVFVELKGDRPRKASLELLSETRKVADSGRYEVEAVVLGPMSEDVREKLRLYAGRLVNITDPVLEAYTAEGYSQALSAFVVEEGARIVAAGATRIGRDFMPRVAVLLSRGIASDVTDVRWTEEPFTVVRPIYGGKVLARISFSGSPAVFTVRPNTFALGEPHDSAGQFLERQAGISPDRIRTKVIRVEEKTKGKVDLTEADIVVSGGHGMKAPENFKLLEDLAEVIGGAVGATRSVVDAKWRDHEDQVGKSGKTVSPRLYIAAGISGAIHHIMGMGTSKVVLAVNKDPNAPIFKHADYGIVGDLFQVLPALTDALKKRLGK
ncbi:MAG TPA: electron transfer flavoprotein subunit alpha/FixB family protein [Syntrophorhabdales bacterium]|nr:electron transfer flavoprotein subunit alpha/FixB family protein [Syntrophorhabdales bacterium]